MNRRAFTLIEMVIVILIIGILAIALIPRLIGVQSRARDTVRTADSRNLSQAITLYGVDNDGNYPPAFRSYTSLPAQALAAATTPTPYNRDRFLASIPADAAEGTTEMLGNNLKSYLSLLPNDPNSAGVKARSYGDPVCDEQGNAYAYYRDADDTRYAITMKMESGNGNAINNCAGVVDTSKGQYKTTGQGLLYHTSESCFKGCFENGEITCYDNSCPKDVRIPPTINGETVTKIADREPGDGVFEAMGITSVIFPDTITDIGKSSFRGNKLTSITFPDNEFWIWGVAFGGNKTLTEITFPENHPIHIRHGQRNGAGRYVGNHFNNCDFRTLHIPDNVDIYAGNTFSNSKNLTSVSVPNDRYTPYTYQTLRGMFWGSNGCTEANGCIVRRP